MAGVNPAWHRYVYASVAKHVHAAAAADGLPIVVEFLDKRGAAWNAATSKAEATITGPITKEISSGLYRVRVNVFITLTSDRGVNDYLHIDHAGALANALDQCVLVKDYGDTGLVDIGSLRPRPEDGENVDVTHLKPKADDDQIYSTVQVNYLGYFTI